MNILITGGKGFIARNLTEAFSAEHKVSSPGSGELDLLNSVKVADTLKAGSFDLVIHSATYDAAPKTSTKDPAKVLNNNLRMFFNIARWNGKFGRLIFFGSGAEFGRENWKPRMSEEYFDAFVPSDQYGFSKYLMTKHALSAKNIYNLRLFGVFGRYEDWRYRFISNLCYQALTGKELSIHQDAVYDYTSIEDIKVVVKKFIDLEPKNKVYNLCSGAAFSRKELAGKVLKCAGKEMKVIFEKNGFAGEYSGDNTRLLSELKGFSFTPIDEAVKPLLDWYKQNAKTVFAEYGTK